MSSKHKMLQSHLRDTLTLALGHNPNQQAMIVFDEQSELSKLLSEGYQSVLPNAKVLNFHRFAPEEILRTFDELLPGDLVILLQSTSFRLSKFRIRIELFNRRLKVIEHPHLSRMRKDEYETYFDSLAYDPSYYRTVGPQLGKSIAHATQITILSDGAELIYDCSFEEPRLNIGHYEGMKNTGGQFPIGEVFTEPKEVTQVNGTVKLFAFGDTDFSVNFPHQPFTAVIEEGVLVSSSDAPKTFHDVMDEIRSQEGVVWLRELGFGLNRALTRKKWVSDIGTYERMCGIHLSLGAKHLQYKKANFPKKGGFHVDVFVDVQFVEIDGVTVFRDGSYQ